MFFNNISMFAILEYDKRAHFGVSASNPGKTSSSAVLVAVDLTPPLTNKHRAPSLHLATPAFPAYNTNGPQHYRRCLPMRLLFPQAQQGGDWRACRSVFHSLSQSSSSRQILALFPPRSKAAASNRRSLDCTGRPPSHPNAALSTPSPTTCLHMPCNKTTISKLCDRQMCKQHCNGRGGCHYHLQQPKQLLPPLTGGSLTSFEDIALYARPPTLTAYVSKEQRDREATFARIMAPLAHILSSPSLSPSISAKGASSPRDPIPATSRASPASPISACTTRITPGLQSAPAYPPPYYPSASHPYSASHTDRHYNSPGPQT
ncbi:hypothetical protein C8R44DRAFT_932388 [Mycena epipterygia]|nr:hypothetical protein C8R44DRAFT_932388 [Mycena epipterygia]